MNVLITGGLGFIGSCFARQAAALSHKPVVLDAISYAGLLDSIEQAAAPIDLVIGSIDDYRLVRRILHDRQIDCVVNFAAETHVDRSLENYVPFVETNVNATWRFASAVADYYNNDLSQQQRQAFKFVHISTDEVFGDAGLADNGVPPRRFDEHSQYLPNTPYAASKAAGDHAVRALSTIRRFPCAIVHSVNNYGPFQHREKLVPKMVYSAFERTPLTLHGDGRHVREWIHVEDNCGAIWTVIEKGEFAVGGERYLVGTGEERDNRWMIGEISSILQRNGCIAPPALIHVADRAGNDRRYAVDSAKVRSLGWRPKCSLATHLEEVVLWYWRRCASASV